MKEWVLHVFNLRLLETSFSSGYSWEATQGEQLKASFQQAQEVSLVAGVLRPWVIISRPLWAGVFVGSRAFLLVHLVTFCESMCWHRSLYLEKTVSLIKVTGASLISSLSFATILISCVLAFAQLPLPSTLNTLMLQEADAVSWLSSYNSILKDVNFSGLLADLLILFPSPHPLLVQQLECLFKSINNIMTPTILAGNPFRYKAK